MRIVGVVVLACFVGMFIGLPIAAINIGEADAIGNTGIIELPNGEIVEGTVEDINNAIFPRGNTIVTMDGITYIVHPSKMAIIQN